MARDSSDLYRHRSATHDFLFSPSDDAGDPADRRSAVKPTDCTVPLDDRYAAARDREGLIRFVDETTASATRLFAIAVGFASAASTDPQTENMTAPPLAAVEAIAAMCARHGGAWGRICQDRLVALFPDWSPDDGSDRAERLLEALGEPHRRSITIGTAAYPTAAGDARCQIVDNAEKALDHGAFFGPGSITAFDAVSLNISGDRRYQAGDLDGAITEYRRGLALDPSDANLNNSLGVCYGVQERFEDALAAFEKAIAMDAGDVMALYNKGYVHLLKGERKQALDCFLRANNRESGIFEVVFHIGQTYLEMDSPEQARPFLEAATRANRGSGAAFRSLGDCLRRLGSTKAAIQAYKRVVKINPADAESLSLLGRLYTQREESLDVAAALCKQSIRLSPHNGLFRHRLGKVYLHQGKWQDALTAFERATALGHDSQTLIERTQARLTAAKAS